MFLCSGSNLHRHFFLLVFVFAPLASLFSDLPPVFPYEKGVDQSCHSFKSYDNACIDRTFGAGVRLTGSIAGVIIATVVGASFLLF